jgi:adenylosuccinate synthase
MKAKIVVGMGYGDEGKGMTVNHLIKDSIDPIVVRFSGGQQAGHTVHVGDIKHTCSNFGAGVIMAVPTYFSEHTTFYPVTIARETEALRAKGIRNPKLTLHPMAKITTPWDVWDNRNCSDNLNDGTCGLGIGATMHRNIVGKIQLTAIDLMHMPTFIEKMRQISYATKMVVMPMWFVEELKEFWLAVESIDWDIDDYGYLETHHTLIFEGSQ